jgi:uncharacterized protein
VRVNLDAHNIGSLEELAQLIEERGWAARQGFQCQLAPVTDHLGTSTYPHRMREEELIEPILEFQRRTPGLAKALNVQLFRVLQHLISVIEQKKSARTIPRFHYCEADRGDVVAFGPDGLMYVCPESAGDTENAIGTYSPHYELHADRLELWSNRNVLELAECQECEIATFCGGGCAYAALQQFGSPAHGVCAEAPEVVRAYMRILQKRFQDGELPLAQPSTE